MAFLPGMVSENQIKKKFFEKNHFNNLSCLNTIIEGGLFIVKKKEVDCRVYNVVENGENSVHVLKHRPPLFFSEKKIKKNFYFPTL